MLLNQQTKAHANPKLDASKLRLSWILATSFSNPGFGREEAHSKENAPRGWTIFFGKSPIKGVNPLQWK